MVSRWIHSVVQLSQKSVPIQFRNLLHCLFNSSNSLKMASNVVTIDNWINDSFVKPHSSAYLSVGTPLTGQSQAQVALSDKNDVDAAVAASVAAFAKWKEMTVKTRVAIIFKIHALIDEHKDELADLICKEHGKTKAEALAEVAKANETVEYACSMPQLISGKTQEVSRGVFCTERRDPLGVVVSIVPFNFPMMVPCWTIPIALATGNTVILKPSEKVPMTMRRVCELFKQAGLPAGVFQTVNGTKDAVEALCDHPEVKCVTFVGTTRVAELLAQRCRALNKRVLALGGAKNHLISAPDRDLEMASADIAASFTGCAGQRCMAASVLLTLGKQQDLIDMIVKKASSLTPGQGNGQMGPVIDQMSKDKIIGYIDQAEAGGAKILLDGRTWVKERNQNLSSEALTKGFWVGPTVILHTNRTDPALHDEIFGPVISILQVDTKEECIEIQNKSPYGNAAAIYTQSGAVADWFCKRFHSGMLGVNIGVPVPREPFSFGGAERSKFGDFDITGDGGIELFTIRKKITTKWTLPTEKNWMN